MNEHSCPICGSSIRLWPRYPKYVCVACCKRAKSFDGFLLEFFNTHLGGGFQAKYADSGKAYRSHQCFIDEVECYADEAHMGGIVIEVGSKPSRLTEEEFALHLLLKGANDEQ